MASPMHYGGHIGGWQNNMSQNQNQNQNPPQGNGHQEPGPQLRPMGLKVHYAFDRDSKENYLTRPPHTLHIQTLQVDDTTSIGLVDLRICIQSIVENSPELTGQDHDYTIYAYDYLESDTPLVGQGMLSWCLASMGNSQPNLEPKMVTGQVTKNLRAAFSGGNKENLEVKLKLTASARRPDPRPMDTRPMESRQVETRPMDIPQARPMDSASTPTAMTPTGMGEWNSFMQSNPQIGQQPPPRGVSPALSHASFGGHAQAPRETPIQPIQPGEPQRVAPTPIGPITTDLPPAPSSRPSSRTSNRAPRKKKPTGNPRGRPRKKKPVGGNTSGYEDGTEGEEPPKKKRVVTTQVDKSAANPFAAGPESLRVAASTSGSLRNFRPVAMSSEAGNAPNHLQEIPRAPTPIPDGSSGLPGRAPFRNKVRRESTMSQEFIHTQNQFAETRLAPYPVHEDSRSPESIGATPNYSEDSPLEIGSSPPVPRATPYMRSSPPQSSPLLPPMPGDQLPRLGEQDLALDNTDMDDMFADEAFQASIQESFPQFLDQRGIEEATDASGVPTQVFRLQPGRDGQDMVHIRNINTPHPTSMPLGPPESMSLPPLRKESDGTGQPGEQRPGQPSPRDMAMTPPPTTDFLDRANSPTGHEAAMPMQGQKAATHQTGPAPSIETNSQSLQQPAASTEMMPTPQMDQGPSPAGTTNEQTLPDTASTSQVGEASAAANQPKPKRQRAKKPPRELTRSQSAGPAMLAPPASDPTGPSTLSQVSVPKSGENRRRVPAALKRSATVGPHAQVIPTSDSIVPDSSAVTMVNPLLLPEPTPSDPVFPMPSSPTGPRFNKNVVKKNAIKQRLEDAIQNGEMPPFCNNCGAIETPTWRKIWTQDHDGEPPELEFSEKPGKVTAIEILERDENEVPTKHRLIMKNLGEEDKTKWGHMLLCNPCGIWLVKSKAHRPRDRWDKDASRQGRKRSSTGTNPRTKKSKTKSDAINPTSEAYLPTDAMEPVAPTSPRLDALMETESTRSGSQGRQDEFEVADDGAIPPDQAPSEPSSQHGGAKSPEDKEFDAAVGTTRRLLFPSPRKDGVPKALGEVNVNIVQTSPCGQSKQPVADKENIVMGPGEGPEDVLEALFRSPAVQRPSTPPPTKGPSQPFKTPTRPTPSHRPVTRSVTRSIRSIRSVRLLESPSRAELESPTSARSRAMRTPRSVRRSPRNHDGTFIGSDMPFDSDLLFANGDMGDSNILTPSGLWAPASQAGVSPSPATRRIIDMLDMPQSPSPGRNRLDTAIGQEVEQLDWLQMLKTPCKSGAAQKFADQGADNWYNGSADMWEEWMKESTKEAESA